MQQSALPDWTWPNHVQRNRMNPLEKIQQEMKIVRLVKESRKPLQTSFKCAYSVSLPVELADLLRTLRSEYNINVSAELLEPIKARAIRIALALNKKMQETQQKCVDS